jgi:hypothetical protein
MPKRVEAMRPFPYPEYFMGISMHTEKFGLGWLLLFSGGWHY